MGGSLRDDALGLIERIARGDREAFGLFYDRFAALVFTFALRLLRVRSDAEELLQEVFLQVWQQAGAYSRERGTPEAWLITITRSRGIDKLRSLRRRDRGVMAGSGENDYDVTVGSGAAESEARIMVQSALIRLSDSHRQVLELAYFDGLTQSEIAERLKEPLGTVKTRMRAALGRLRELLGGEAI